MTALDIHQTVGEIVIRRPALSRVFEAVGIDYCCGGKKSLEQACREKRLDLNEMVSRLAVADAADLTESTVDAGRMTLAELVNHIVETHHAYLRAELPRLEALAGKVASAHGGREPRLHELWEAFAALARELSAHMMKEERILFPLIRALEGGEAPDFPGSLAGPIGQMEREHDEAGSGLARQRELTDDFTPPAWACNSYRVLLDGLVRLERDLHQHIHKENNMLFPRALALRAREHAPQPAP